MLKFSLDSKKVADLIEYYKNKDLLIIGLNDSQGVNITSTFFKKGLLEYLASSLASDRLRPKVINAFSLTMNKTEHIDYFFKNNLSIEEVKLSQIYGVVSAFEKVMEDVGLPKSFGRIGNLYRLIYAPLEGDDRVHISTSLKDSDEVIMIYSSGVNNLMREIGSNPFAIQKDYKLREIRPNYYYALDKAKNPETLRSIINSIERNYDHILGINPDTDIYTLGAYIPKSLQREDMALFQDVILSYNEELSNLCRKYGIVFIDTAGIGKAYNRSKNNFHISTTGHNALANYILQYIYQRKLGDLRRDCSFHTSEFEISNGGSQGVLNDIFLDYDESYHKAMELTGYARERELLIADEHKREAEVFQKVLSKRKR